ncbi:hypothetical protein F5Y18DRAFT_108484 [Xylariaceae sp. FL1019]|nr:hypothetical protein F5Y18DRAFT_108484 [Xylariaceae sp. FL1019]
MVLTALKGSKSALEVVMEVTTPGVTCGDGLTGGGDDGLPACLVCHLKTSGSGCHACSAALQGFFFCLTSLGLLGTVAWCATQPGLPEVPAVTGLLVVVTAEGVDFSKVTAEGADYSKMKVTLRQGSADKWCAPAEEDFDRRGGCFLKGDCRGSR